MPLKAVFFDLDGTLLDTSGSLGGALNRVRAAHELPPLPMTQIRSQVSNGAGALIRLGFGDRLSESTFEQRRQQLLDFYLADIARDTLAFPGVPELIAQLSKSGLLWGIVTNKPSLYTRALMQHFRFASPPVATVSPDQVGVGKPDPKPLLRACELADCHPAEALYVGDHKRDIECGQRAGMPTIAVGYGFTESPEEHRHWGATHQADRVDDLWPIFRHHL